MYFSIIIATRNRCHRLATCLEYLRQLDVGEHRLQVVLVDNGSTDETPSVMSSFASTFSHPVTLVREPVQGVSRAKNAGIAQAQGDVLIFIDDDCYIDTAYLHEVAALYSASGITYIGGRVLLHDPTDAPATTKTSETPALLPPGSFLWPGVILGANWSSRREALQAVGGFDNELGPGTPYICEELDLLERMSLVGFSGGYFPGPTVRHHHGRKRGDDTRLLGIAYAYGCGAYYAKFLCRRQTCLAVALRYPLHLIRRIRKREWHGVAAQCRGTWDYLFHVLRRERNPRSR